MLAPTQKSQIGNFGQTWQTLTNSKLIPKKKALKNSKKLTDFRTYGF